MCWARSTRIWRSAGWFWNTHTHTRRLPKGLCTILKYIYPLNCLGWHNPTAHLAEIWTRKHVHVIRQKMNEIQMWPKISQRKTVMQSRRGVCTACVEFILKHELPWGQAVDFSQILQKPSCAQWQLLFKSMHTYALVHVLTQLTSRKMTGFPLKLQTCETWY